MFKINSHEFKINLIFANICVYSMYLYKLLQSKLEYSAA